MAAGGERTGVVQVPEDVTFYAPLVINTQDYASKVQQSFTRTSGATLNRSGQLRRANDNASRHESVGLLVEPASTNKCTNYNANPDAALTNLFLNGANATMSRVLDKERLNAAGLGSVCTSGYVLKLDNTAGVALASIQVSGGANLNVHAVSAYARAEPGSEGQCSVRISGSASPAIAVTSTSFSKYTVAGTPDADTRVFEFAAQAGHVGYFILNQLEEQPIATSIIITEGAAGVRAVDALQWSLDSILNQTEGMVALTWYPGFSDPDLQTGTVQSGRLLSFEGPTFLYHQKEATNENTFKLRDGTNVRSVTVPGGWVKDVPYVVVGRWAGTSMQVGYKAGVTWIWSAGGTYKGSFDQSGVLRLASFTGTLDLATHSKDAYLWTVDKGTAWLESFFSGVAN